MAARCFYVGAQRLASAFEGSLGYGAKSTFGLHLHAGPVIFHWGYV